MDFIDKYNMAVGAAVTILSTLLGRYWYLFGAFLLFNVIDYLTGWYKSRYLKQESSEAGLKGIIKKVMYWVIIGVAFTMAYIMTHMGQDLLGIDLSFTVLFGWFTLASLLVNEIRSVLENIVASGVEGVPEFLLKGLSIADKLLKEKTGGGEDV